MRRLERRRVCWRCGDAVRVLLPQCVGKGHDQEEHEYKSEGVGSERFVRARHLLRLSTAVCAFNPSPYRFEAVSERVALRLEELDVLYLR